MQKQTARSLKRVTLGIRQQCLPLTVVPFTNAIFLDNRICSKPSSKLGITFLKTYTIKNHLV